jgi:hypothetical protein
LKNNIAVKQDTNQNIPPQGASYQCQYVTRFLWWSWGCNNEAVEFCRQFCFGIFCDKHIEKHRKECYEDNGI